jgi:hypothetical protein
LRYNAYDHPNIKAVAIVLGDEFSIYYPASYTVLSTVPVVAAPTPPSTDHIVPVCGRLCHRLRPVACATC